MKKKTLQLIVGVSAAAMLACTPALAEETEEVTVVEVTNDTEANVAEDVGEPAVLETEAAAPAQEQEVIIATQEATPAQPAADNQAHPAANDQQQPAQPQSESETEAETELIDDFIEGSALLSELDYEAGEIKDDEWTSEWLGLIYTPAKDVKISKEDTEKMKEYYGRHGEDRYVANNEFVAKMGTDGILQLMVEVNPNGESAKDILENFTKIEELDLVSKTRETDVAGKKFYTCTGVHEKEKYMIGACDEVDGVVLAFKIRYKDTASRKAMLEGFKAIKSEEETEPATETVAEEETEAAVETAAEEPVSEEAIAPETEAETGLIPLEIPEEFEDALLITEEATEAAPAL